MPGPCVAHHLLDFAQVHVHCIGDILVKSAQIINHRIISNKCCIELPGFWSGRWRIKKQRHYFANKGPSIKAMFFFFSVVMYGCESWTINKAEHQRIDAFELQCWRRLFRVPWAARRSNQSILNINPGVHWKDGCWSWNYSTLATWSEELTHLKRPSCWEILRAGGERDNRGWDGWMASLRQRTWVWVNLGSWWWTGKPGMLWSTGSQRVRHDWVTELNWTCYSTVPNLY